MFTERFVSTTSYLAWSDALNHFEDSFIAICDYRPIDKVDMDIVQILRKECLYLFDLMENEIDFSEEKKVDYMDRSVKDNLEKKIIRFTVDLLSINIKIKKFLANKTMNNNVNTKYKIKDVLYFPMHMN